MPLRAARATANLRAALDAGVASVREAGGLGIHLMRAVAEGVLDGPTSYPAVRGGSSDYQQFTQAELRAILGVAGMAERAATAAAWATLGPQAPRSGQLVAGYDADVLTVDGDPLTEFGVLAMPEAISGVWKARRRVKPAITLVSGS